MSQVYTFCPNKNKAPAYQNDNKKTTPILTQSASTPSVVSTQSASTPSVVSQGTYSFKRGGETVKPQETDIGFSESNFPSLGAPVAKPKALGCWGNPIKLDVIKEPFKEQPSASSIKKKSQSISAIKKNTKQSYLDDYEDDNSSCSNDEYYFSDNDGSPSNYQHSDPYGFEDEN